MSQNINPYEAPQVEETIAPIADVVFRVRPMIALAGGALGLIATIMAMGATGVSLAVTTGRVRPSPNILTQHGLEFFAAILAGVGASILFDSLCQDKFSLLAPGHWFLLLLSARPISQYGTDLLAFVTRIEIDSTLYDALHFVQIAIYLILVLVLLAPIALTTTESRRWNRLLWSMLVASLVVLLLYPIALFNQSQALSLIGSSFEFISQLGSFALGATVFVLGSLELVGNRQKAKRRDIYHWLGVFLTPPLPLLSIIQMNEFGFI